MFLPIYKNNPTALPHLDGVIVQSRASGASLASSPQALAFSSNVEAGTWLYCAIHVKHPTGSVNFVSDSRGNTWIRLGSIQDAANQRWIETWTAFNVTAGACTVSVAFSGV